MGVEVRKKHILLLPQFPANVFALRTRAFPFPEQLARTLFFVPTAASSRAGRENGWLASWVVVGWLGGWPGNQLVI